MIKYTNYQVYINPEFSTRFDMDKHGGLLINPILQEDEATYECRGFMSTNTVTHSIVHGSSINLKIQGKKTSNLLYRIKIQGSYLSRRNWLRFIQLCLALVPVFINVKK